MRDPLHTHSLKPVIVCYVVSGVMCGLSSGEVVLVLPNTSEVMQVRWGKTREVRARHDLVKECCN